MTVSLSSSADVRSALEIIEETLLPAPVEAIEVWLAALTVKTARRKESGVANGVTLSVYTDHLRAYPGDAVRHVLSSYRGTFFPTWGELADLLDEFTEPRLMIRDRLAEMFQGKSETVTEAPTLEQLRNELAALNRMLLRFPETACEKTDRLRDELVAGIERLSAN